MKRSNKELTLAIEALPNPLADESVRRQNVRDIDSASYQEDAIGALMDDLAQNGQTDPIMLEKVKNEAQPRIIRGFRRSIAIRRLREQNRIDPVSRKLFGEEVRVVFVEDMTDLERIQLMIDQGQRRGLSPAEVQTVATRMFDNGATEKDVVVALRTIIDSVWPPKKEVKTDDEYFNYRRQVVQTLHHAARAPYVLQEARLNKLRGKQNWPNDKDTATLSTLAVKEFGESREYNRDNPGPKFREAWDKILAKVAEADAAGTRPKGISMLNNAQVEEAGNQSQCLTIKIVCDIVRNKVARDQLPVLDKWLFEKFEKALSEDDKLFLVNFGK